MTGQPTDIFQKLKEKFDNDYPNLKYKINQFELLVPKVSDSGFDVSLSKEGTKFIVYFEGWHELFDNEWDAQNCFIWGLSTETQLQVFSKAGVDYKWIAEMKEDGDWVDQGTTALIFFPFWSRKKVRVLQNDHIRLKN